MYSSLQGCHTATGTHMLHGITQCYLPPDRGDIPALTPAEAGTRLSDPRGMQLGSELTYLACYIPRWYIRPKTVTHPGTNRARRASTLVMRQTPPTTTPRRVFVCVVQLMPLPSQNSIISCLIQIRTCHVCTVAHCYTNNTCFY